MAEGASHPQIKQQMLLLCEKAFVFNMKNISILKNPINSAKCVLNNIPWYLTFAPILGEDNEKYLRVDICCETDKELDEWSVLAELQVQLLPINEKNVAHSHRNCCIFTKVKNVFPIEKFAKYSTHLAENGEFVQGDKAKLKVHIKLLVDDQSIQKEIFDIVRYNTPAFDDKHLVYSELPLNNLNISHQPQPHSSYCIFGCLRFMVKNISQLKGTMCSPIYYYKNLPWRIKVFTKPNKGMTLFGFSLQCNWADHSQSWSCRTVVRMTIQGKAKAYRDLHAVAKFDYSAKEFEWGPNQFIDFDRLIDEEKGYCSDDTIKIEAQVFAEEPIGLNLDKKPQVRITAMECVSDGDIIAPASHLHIE